jgi:hypothetical protein
LKIIASRVDASRTRPDDCRTNKEEEEEGCLDVSMSYSFVGLQPNHVVKNVPTGIADKYLACYERPQIEA